MCLADTKQLPVLHDVAEGPLKTVAWVLAPTVPGLPEKTGRMPVGVRANSDNTRVRRGYPTLRFGDWVSHALNNAG